MRDRLNLRKRGRVGLVLTSMLKGRKGGRREGRRMEMGLRNEIRARQSFYVGAR